jgi:CheY-like chemotaxis protein
VGVESGVGPAIPYRREVSSQRIHQKVRIPLMSLLVLESDPDRINCFKKVFFDHSTTILTNTKLFKAWLNDHAPKIICMDGHLEDGNGYDITKILLHHRKKLDRSLLVIFEENKKMARSMQAELQKHKLTVSYHPNLWTEQGNLARLRRMAQDFL